jgi:hypothetical protein
MKRLFGGILLAIGILIMTGSGLCSLVVIATFASEGGGEGLGMLMLPVIVGGLPFAIGFGLFYAGKVLLRREKVLDEDELRERFD